MAILNAKIWELGAEIGMLPGETAEREPGRFGSSAAEGVEEGKLAEEVEEKIKEELEEELEAMFEEIMAEGPDYRKGAGDDRDAAETLGVEKRPCTAGCGAGIDPVPSTMAASTAALLQKGNALLDRFRGSQVCPYFPVKRALFFFCLIYLRPRTLEGALPSAPLRTP